MGLFDDGPIILGKQYTITFNAGYVLHAQRVTRVIYDANAHPIYLLTDEGVLINWGTVASFAPSLRIENDGG